MINSIKKISIGFVCVLLLHSTAFATVYNIDSSHSSVEFEVTHLLISKVKGVFNEFSGQINWDPTKLKKSSFEGNVFVKSIDTNNAKRDEHLIAPDFFDLVQYPKINLKSIKIRPTKVKGEYTLFANLTMKNVTKRIVAPLTVKGPVKDNWGNNRMAFETTFTINRFDYNVNWDSVIETGQFVVGKDVTITALIQGIEAK